VDATFTALDRCGIFAQVAAPAGGHARAGGVKVVRTRSALLSAWTGYVERARGMLSYQSSGTASFAWLAF
jgi:hypothetical protein